MPNENEESRLDDLFNDKEENQNNDESNTNINSFTEEQKSAMQMTPPPSTPVNHDPFATNDPRLNNMLQTFYCDGGPKAGISDIKIENNNATPYLNDNNATNLNIPNEAYKESTNKDSSYDVTSLKTSEGGIEEPNKNQLAPEIQKVIDEANQPKDLNNITIKDERQDIEYVKETPQSIKEFEEKAEKKEKEEIENYIKKEEEFIENIAKDINSEMVETTEQEINEIQPKIKEYVDNKEVQKKTPIEKKKEDGKIKEYLGGSADTSLFKHVTNIWSKRYKNIPSESIPEKIIGKDFIMRGTEEDIADFYKQKARVTSLSKTKVFLPFSGMTVWVNSYTGATLSNLFHRYTRWRAQYEYARDNNENENMNQMVSESYYKLREYELDSIYEHIDQIHIAGKDQPEPKPDKETFFKMVKYPDLNTLYFAVFHSTNKNKRKKYTITCHKEVVNTETGETEICDGETDVSLYDEELVFTIENPYITKEEFYLMIRDKFPKDRKLGTMELSMKEIHRLSDTKVNFVQHLPSIWDYLETLSLMNRMMVENNNSSLFSYDISLIDAEIPEDEWTKEKWDKAKLLKSYLYMKRIDFPYLEDEKKGDVSYRTISTEKNQRELIFDFLNSLDLDDTYYLTQGEGIMKMMTVKILNYYIPGLKCSKCGSDIEPIPFNIRMNFFIQVSEARLAKI